jgi:hypothetical protein
MNGAEYVKNYYRLEEDSDISHYESTSMNFSLRMPADKLALFDALANRFRSSRNSLAGEILSKFAMDAFAELSQKDRRKIAVKADELAEAYYQKIGVTVDTSGFQGMADIYDRIDAEREAAKVDKESTQENAA